MEVRDHYAPSYEKDSYQKFLAGESYDLPWMQDWLSMVRLAASEGRTFARVRVVSMPLSDYSRWSYAVAQHNAAAGEDIRYINRELAQDVGLPDHDYWLFDSRRLLRMHFDGNDGFVGGEIIEDPAEVVHHNYVRDVAWHHAVRRDEFASKEQLGRT